MRILHTVEFYEPLKGGAEEVVRQISERLAARGHQLTVATSFHPNRSFSERNGVAVQSFQVRGNLVKGITGDSARYQEFLLDSDFDVIMNYAAQTWTTDLTFPLLPRLRGKKVIAPLGYSRLGHRRYRKYFSDLPSRLGGYDRLVYTSAHYQDKYFGDQNGLADKAVVIPNGAAAEDFSQAQRSFREKYGIHTKYLFLSVSNHYFAKGHRMVIEAFRRAAIPDATLVIIGERPHSHSWYSCYPLCRISAVLNGSIRVLTDVGRPWVISAFQEADCFLFASRVECAPLVMYECFASRTPLITTSVGNVGDHRDFLDIVGSAEEMSSRIRAYVADPEPFAARAQAARSVFERELSWSQIAHRFELLYESL